MAADHRAGGHQGAVGLASVECGLPVLLRDLPALRVQTLTKLRTALQLTLAHAAVLSFEPDKNGP